MRMPKFVFTKKFHQQKIHEKDQDRTFEGNK